MAKLPHKATEAAARVELTKLSESGLLRSCLAGFLPNQDGITGNKWGEYDGGREMVERRWKHTIYPPFTLPRCIDGLDRVMGPDIVAHYQ